ncbi:N-glycosylation protein-domain-containing protein [Lasiosphaeris hirsuta]|uniref:N-glycosylation protein-domain-containing protein n=1 Tax=Lasiosphaeris hirsuta TaxID=260670 RepID=A0AA40E948_9PEZI|nr:N-glycosylation protein-domain-containing protein [Lasiosphaeris hirsuta]
MSNRARTPAQRWTADTSSSIPASTSNNGAASAVSTTTSASTNSSTDTGFAAHSNNPSRKSSRSSKHRRHHYGDDAPGAFTSLGPASTEADGREVTARSSLLQPRVAVVLGVSKKWYPLLFLCRLLSIIPAVYWGLPIGLRLVAMTFFGRTHVGCPSILAGTAFPEGTPAAHCEFEARLRQTETLLATVWCLASGYLSFFFTDCLMSRWLVNYTPQATLVRLLTIAAINGYLTSCALWITGGSADPRLLLPSWIAISTTLTAAYHVTQRKINIRKETSMSVSVFSIASFFSMVALLVQLHSNRSDYPQIPLEALARRVWHEAVKAALAIMEYGNVTADIF